MLCQRSSSISLMLCVVAAILFCSNHFICSAATDGQKYRRMQMMQFLKRNIPEYYRAMEAGVDSATYNARSKYGISVAEVYEHYLRERVPFVRQKTDVYAIMPEKDSSGDSVNIEPEYNDTITSVIEPENQDAAQSAAKSEDYYLFKIYFGIGESDIDENMSSNKSEITAIRALLSKLMTDGSINDYHITVTGMCSPEGTFISNLRLAQNRCESVRQYLELPSEAELKNECEGWQMLDDMVAADPVLTFEQKCEYVDICETADRDLREAAIRRQSFYEYFIDALYPHLRIVFIAFSRCSDLDENQVSL